MTAHGARHGGTHLRVAHPRIRWSRAPLPACSRVATTCPAGTAGPDAVSSRAVQAVRRSRLRLVLMTTALAAVGTMTAGDPTVGAATSPLPVFFEVGSRLTWSLGDASLQGAKLVPDPNGWLWRDDRVVPRRVHRRQRRCRLRTARRRLEHRRRGGRRSAHLPEHRPAAEHQRAEHDRCRRRLGGRLGRLLGATGPAGGTAGGVRRHHPCGAGPTPDQRPGLRRRRCVVHRSGNVRRLDLRHGDRAVARRRQHDRRTGCAHHRRERDASSNRRGRGDLHHRASSSRSANARSHGRARHCRSGRFQVAPRTTKARSASSTTRRPGCRRSPDCH